MGIKNFFKTKPPTEEEVNDKVRNEMNDHGIPIKSSKKKPQLFSAYNNYANDKSEKKIYAPKGYEEHALNNRGEKVVVPGQNQQNDHFETNSNPYAGHDQGPSGSSSSNPYSTLNSQNSYASGSSNPYGQSTGSSNPYGQQSAGPSNPYGQQSAGAANPYGQQSAGSSNPYGQQSADSANTYASSQRGHDQGSIRSSRQPQQNPYGGKPQGNPYSSKSSVSKQPYGGANQAALEEDLNEVPDNASTRPPSYRQQQMEHPRDQQFDFEDLNQVPEEDLNEYGYDQELEQEQTLSPEELEEIEKQRQEDEEVEGVKNQMRFIKQDSVASTRNTLRMAREAEESGKNTMGMLGNQSETLYNIERNLDLAKTQDKIAKEKVAQLQHYNRNILKPSVQNPFTKSRRLREKEERIKNDRLQYKLTQDQQRRELSQSTNRIKNSLNDGDNPTDSITSKYKREKYLQQAKQYQFEADSEDDEMENEIGENVDEVAKIAGRLKKLAMNQGEEIDRQNYRLRNAEDDMNDLDINVHLNTTKLSGTR